MLVIAVQHQKNIHVGLQSTDYLSLVCGTHMLMISTVIGISHKSVHRWIYKGYLILIKATQTPPQSQNNYI